MIGRLASIAYLIHQALNAKHWASLLTDQSANAYQFCRSESGIKLCSDDVYRWAKDLFDTDKIISGIILVGAIFSPICSFDQ